MQYYLITNNKLSFVAIFLGMTLSAFSSFAEEQGVSLDQVLKETQISNYNQNPQGISLQQPQAQTTPQPAQGPYQQQPAPQQQESQGLPSGYFGGIDVGIDGTIHVDDDELIDLINQGSESKNPTLVFIAALMTCNDGEYYERNTMFQVMGPNLLKHQIIGGKDAFCHALLSTPDERQLDCLFHASDLEELSDKYFLSGFVYYDIKSPSLKSVLAEVQWSELKIRSCDFPYYIAQGGN